MSPKKHRISSAVWPSALIRRDQGQGWRSYENTFITVKDAIGSDARARSSPARTLRSSPEALYVASLERAIGLTPPDPPVPPTHEPAVHEAEAPVEDVAAASEAEAPEKEAAGCSSSVSCKAPPLPGLVTRSPPWWCSRDLFLLRSSPVSVLNLNVTSLTAARLEVVLAHAAAVSALVVCLQETRHHADSLWICRHAHNYGWHSAISAPSFWRPCFGRTSPVSFLDSTRSEDDHRHVACALLPSPFVPCTGMLKMVPTYLGWVTSCLVCPSRTCPSSSLAISIGGLLPTWCAVTAGLSLTLFHARAPTRRPLVFWLVLKPLFHVPTSCLAFPIMLRCFSLCPFPALSVLLLPAFVGVRPSSGSALMLCLHSPPGGSLLTLVGLRYLPTRLSQSGGRVGVSVLSFLFARRRPKVSRSFLVRVKSFAQALTASRASSCCRARCPASAAAPASSLV